MTKALSMYWYGNEVFSVILVSIIKTTLIEELCYQIKTMHIDVARSAIGVVVGAIGKAFLRSMWWENEVKCG